MKSKPLKEKLVIDAMHEARRGGQPWFVAARLLRDTLARAPDESAASRIRSQAAEATRLSPGVLRRYVALLDRLDGIATIEGFDMNAIVSPVFNAAEVAVRIYDRNPEEGVKALLELKAGDATLVQLRERLTKVPVWLPDTDERTAAVRQRRKNESAAKAFFERLAVRIAFMSQALERSPLMPSGGRLVRRRSTSLFSSREGSLEIVTESADGAEVTIHAGAELLVYERGEVRSFERAFPALALLATFYPRFHLVFSPGTPVDYVEAAQRLIALFGTASIGIAKVNIDGDLQRILEPTGPPQPDRTVKFTALFRVRRGHPAPRFAKPVDGG
jgi:hypothetical protein